MGLTINLIEHTAKFAKTYGKKSILATKPQNLASIDFATLKPLRSLSTDVCTFPQDPTLAPEFLDDLLKVKGTQTEQIMQIKDRFLRAMGYKPELVREKGGAGNMNFGVDFLDGTLSLPRNKQLRLTLWIPAVRHEVDHLDKVAKIVKSEGVEAFESAIIERVQKQNATLGKPVDRDFWLKFSENADIRGFDSKKYLDAIKNYHVYLTRGSSSSTTYDIANIQHAYCRNELEKSAYAYQKKLLRYYGEDDTVPPDIYGETFGKIKEIIDKYTAENKIKPIKNFSGPQTFNLLSDISIGMSNSKSKKVLKYFQDLNNGSIEKKPEKQHQEMLEILQDTILKMTSKDYKAYMERIYSWLKEGKFTLNDFDFS